MKYIKLFEGFDETQELIELCESHLAYLLDDWFTLSIVKVRVKRSDYPRMISLTLMANYPLHTWDEIKDYFIPFLEVLCDSYKINGVTFNGLSDHPLRVKEQDVINDNLIENKHINTISMLIES